MTCKSCGGHALSPGDGSGHPWGWYSLSVAVPPELAKSGKPYSWVGTFCSARCLAAGMPAIAEAERLTRQSYTPDLPQRPGPEHGPQLVQAPGHFRPQRGEIGPEDGPSSPALASLMREPPQGRG